MGTRKILKLQLSQKGTEPRKKKDPPFSGAHFRKQRDGLHKVGPPHRRHQDLRFRTANHQVFGAAVAESHLRLGSPTQGVRFGGYLSLGLPGKKPARGQGQPSLQSWKLPPMGLEDESLRRQIVGNPCKLTGWLCAGEAKRKPSIALIWGVPCPVSSPGYGLKADYQCKLFEGTTQTNESRGVY